MNLLIDRLPESVEIGGVEFRINSGFRTAVLFELMMQDDFFTPAERKDIALRLFYPIIPDDTEAAIDALLWFYRGGREERSGARSRVRQQRIYSFEHDDQYIYSAFLQQYGIDLNTAQLHWWQFKSMLIGLREDCRFCKIMQYRSMEIQNDMTKAEQRFYREMKQLYALPLSDNEQQKLDAIEAALMGDGDLSGLL